MPKFLASEDYDPDTYVDDVREHFAAQSIDHLRVRRYSDQLIIESGSKQDAIKHARLRRVTKHLWRLEMANHSGRWEVTLYRDQLKNLLALLTGDLRWTLAPRE